MSKILNFLIIFISFFALSNIVDASTANIKVSTNYSQYVVGNTVSVSVTVSSSEALGTFYYTLNYNSSLFSYVSGDLNAFWEIEPGVTTKSKTFNYTFKAKNSGSGIFNITNVSVANFDVKLMETNITPRTVSVITQSQLEASYSKNNNLKGLEVVGYELDQEFSSDILEYNVSVPEGTETIEIKGTKEDSKSSVAGTGEVEVSFGLNKFDIIVTAQNGSTKTYILNVTVEDKNPISVKIDDKSYTILKDKRGLVIPTTYVESTTVINDIEVPSLYGELLDYTLVGLKDESGNIVLAIYDEDNNSYELYTELMFNSFSIIPKDYDKELDDYVLEEVDINGKLVMAYVKDGSDYYLIYGINSLSGEEYLYQYDSIEKTIQRFDEESLYNEELKIYKLATYGLAGLVVLSFIGIFIASSKRKKVVDDNIFTKSSKKSKKNEDEEIYELLDSKKKKKK